MGRAKKQTVDYFYHPVKNGTRMFVMEQLYGDKGYCCYYKLLEMLGSSEGHYIDFSISKNIMYFSALVRSTQEETVQMLDKLCELGTIDPELWLEKRIVWCQEFLDHLSDLYSRRSVSIPTKENILADLGQHVVDHLQPNVDIKPQSKVEYSKVNKSIILAQTSFDAFWLIYDKKVGKEKAEKKWNKLSEKDRASAMAHIPKYKQAQPNKQYRKDPCTFINNKSWNDELIVNEPDRINKPWLSDFWSPDNEAKCKTPGQLQEFWAHLREKGWKCNNGKWNRP